MKTSKGKLKKLERIQVQGDIDGDVNTGLSAEYNGE